MWVALHPYSNNDGDDNDDENNEMIKMYYFSLFFLPIQKFMDS